MEDAPTQSRLFIGIAIPPTPMEAIKTGRKRFTGVIEKRVPLKNWHMTLVFLGDVPDTQQVVAAFPKKISFAFMPTMAVTHIGKGKVENSLWAYVQATPAMQELKTTVEDALQKAGITFASDTRDFVPHISIAYTQPDAAPMTLLDVACPVTFPIREIVLYQSSQVDGDTIYTPVSSASVTT